MKHIFLLGFIFCNTTIGLNAQTGIGTTTPAVKLHVKSNGPILRLEGSDHAYMEWYPQGSITRYGYMGYPNAAASPTQLTFMNQFTTESIAFGTNGTNKMFLNSDGKLGLGTSSPGTSLHIENGNSFGTDPSITTSPSLYIYNNNNASSTANSTATIRVAGAGGGKPYLSLDVNGVSERMPWYGYVGANTGYYSLASGSGNWWGTLIANNQYYAPAPWIGTLGGYAANPGIIWYWVR